MQKSTLRLAASPTSNSECKTSSSTLVALPIYSTLVRSHHEALQKGCWCFPEGQQETKYSELPREWALIMLPWYSLHYFKGAALMCLSSCQGSEEEVSVFHTGCAGIARLSGIPIGRESCLQCIHELELSLAWSVPTLTPTVLKEFPTCFFPLIREPLGHNRAFSECSRPSSSAESGEGGIFWSTREDNLQLPKWGCKQDSSYKC